MSNPLPEPVYYFVKLVSPRPDFILNMTPEECMVMTTHGQYWREKMKRGLVVVFGPVADPAGPWGLGVVRASSPEELLEFQENDPAIRANIGLRYEALPMIRTVLPDRA